MFIVDIREFKQAIKVLLALPKMFRRLESMMANATEQLTALSGKVDDLIADVQAKLDIINQDQLSAQAQAALDELVAKVDAFDASVGDADGSENPPVEPAEPTEPAAPAEGDAQR